MNITVVTPSSDWCLLAWPHSCMADSAWAAWVQAVGSIAAILATIWVMQRQQRNQSQAARQARNDHEMLQCNRALLACYGDLNGAQELLKAHTDSKASGWPFSAPGMRQEQIIGIDLDSLAFLAGRGAQDVLNTLSRVREMAGSLTYSQNGLADYFDEKIESLLEEALIQKGSDLTFKEMQSAVGMRRLAVLTHHAGDIPIRAAALIAFLEDRIPTLRRRVSQIFPRIVMPDGTPQ